VLVALVPPLRIGKPRRCSGRDDSLGVWRERGEKEKAAQGGGRAASSGTGCFYECSERIANWLPVGHFLGHVQQQFAIFLVGFAQQAAELVEIARFFSGAAPGDIVGRFALGQVRKLRRLFAVVEELIKWALERARQFFQSFDGRNRVAIFNTGNVTTQETGTLLDITLGEFLFFAQSAKTITDNHAVSIP